MRKLHNIRCVTFHGIPDAFAHELKAHMEAPPISLLDLPRELRDLIYSDCGDWSGVSQQLSRTMAKWTDRTKEPSCGKLETPIILLLNKQITKEALLILHKKPLVLNFPEDNTMQEQLIIPNMLNFIKGPTLRNIQHLGLNVQSWEWICSLDRLLPELATSQSLKTVSVHFTDRLKHQYLADGATYQYPDNTLHDTLRLLAKIRGLDSMSFTGDLPSCYTGPLAQIMQTPASSTTALPKLFATKGDGCMVELDVE